ncbi:hypothetical protein [Sessilibacter sp. MAH2]
MKFRELPNFINNKLEPELSKSIIKNQLNINAPDSVVKQFYIDHSDKDEFISMYGHIDLTKILWSLIEVHVDEIISISTEATFPDYMNEVSEDASYFSQIGEKVISSRLEIREHWKMHGTWRVPPVFISRELLNPPSIKGLHLVEGHTRVGCLKGLSKYKVIDVKKYHKVYFGSY